MPERADKSLWQSLLLRLIVIWLVGWVTVLWFRGCLAPSAREEIGREQEKAASVPAPFAR